MMPENTLERVSIYRRLLCGPLAESAPQVYARQLAAMTRYTAAQVRREGPPAPPAGAATSVAHWLVRAGVKGLLNFAPTPLRVPATVCVEQIDMTTPLEKVAFFARGVAARKDVSK
jgi:NADH/NAD ratio-sensing transcriptional regulator Rex